MDEYEEFFDGYIKFIKKYENASLSDLTSMYSDYISWLSKYESMIDKMESIDEDSLSAADYAYYVEVTTRIYNKLADVY